MDEKDLGAANVVAGAAPLTDAEQQQADSLGVRNDERVEMLWMHKVVEFFETYMRILRACQDPSRLRLTGCDDDLYARFRRDFPDFNVALVSEAELKSEDAKKKWRKFLSDCESGVKDFNVGTLVRIDASKGYSEQNTILVLRAQFYAIEIARNREGLNRSIEA